MPVRGPDGLCPLPVGVLCGSAAPCTPICIGRDGLRPYEGVGPLLGSQPCIRPRMGMAEAWRFVRPGAVPPFRVA